MGAAWSGDSSVADLVGKKLKDFYVLRRLGRGAMAEVYLAQQLSLGRQVALKVLDAELARDPNYVRRFQHEARSAAALVHAGIVQIYEVGEEEGVHYIAQEYVAGRNLGEVIRSRGSLPPEVVLDILRQVAAALSKACSAGIVHRDIKPENIMLARSGEVKVADFGLARAQGDGAAMGAGTALTQIGVTMGTPLYMSPEQIEGRPLDSRSDIYSLGVTAYHMLAGRPPFHGDTPLAVAVQHLNQPPVPLSKQLPHLPARLEQIIERMMAKKPEERFSDPAALLAELDAVGSDVQRGLEERKEAEREGAYRSTLAELVQSADERAAVTTRLDQLMRTMSLAQQKPVEKRQRRRIAAAMVLGGLLVGAVLAVVIRPASLLAGAASGVPRKETAWAQLYHAKVVDTEAAWQAVIENFPNGGQYYHNLARQGLVYCYLLRSHEYGKAIPLAEQLAASDTGVYQAFGIAGLVVAYARLGDDEQAYYANQRLDAEMRALLNEQAPLMARLLNEALDELAERAL